MATSANDNRPGGLEGVRVLVVEDDPFLSVDLEMTLVSAGAIVVGRCKTLRDALALSDAPDFSVAVLDFSLGNETIAPVARKLASRSIPFILYTGLAGREPKLAEWADRLIVQKPSPPRMLVAALRAALRR